MNREQVYNTIKEGEPLSLIRCGDGEKIVLEGFESYGNYNSVLKRQLGYSPSIEEAERIRENLIKAINGCDILGVPKHKNLDSMHKHWKEVETIIDKHCQAPSLRCSTNIHYDLLENKDYESLLTSKPISYIGCRDLVTGMSERFKTHKVDWYQIAPEAKYTSGWEGPKHYPDQFNKVEKWMDTVRAHGKILLVGAGFIGKIYCNWWRDRGGIALDIGSIMDEWAGRVTRGANRELDKIEITKWTL